jgi:hypothetical protein
MLNTASTVFCTCTCTCTVLYCTVLYCTVLYCTVLYCTCTCFHLGSHRKVGAIHLYKVFMATRDATCIAPGFGTGNGREKMEKREFGARNGKMGRDSVPISRFPVHFPFFFKPVYGAGPYAVSSCAIG